MVVNLRMLSAVASHVIARHRRLRKFFEIVSLVHVRSAYVRHGYMPQDLHA